MPIAKTVPQRHPAATWTSSNPVLLLGEIGVEEDTRNFKIGDGHTAWNSLGYAGFGSTVTSLPAKPQTIDDVIAILVNAGLCQST